MMNTWNVIFYKDTPIFLIVDNFQTVYKKGTINNLEELKSIFHQKRASKCNCPNSEIIGGKMDKIYFDYCASTPLHPEVCETFCHFTKNVYANPSSVHKMGFEASELVEESKKNSQKPKSKTK